jgi:hypothetical protein
MVEAADSGTAASPINGGTETELMCFFLIMGGSYHQHRVRTLPGNNGSATACTGSVTASTASQMNVTSFGADARSLITGNSATVNWTLTNDPKYKTGSYSATATFTISVS